MHSLCTSKHNFNRPKSEKQPISTDCRVVSPVVDPDPIGSGWIHPNPKLLNGSDLTKRHEDK